MADEKSLNVLITLSNTVRVGVITLTNTSTFLNSVLMDGIPETLIVMKVKEDNDFSYEFANQRALERTTLKVSDIGKSVYDVNSAGNDAFYIENHKKVVQTKEMMTFEDTYSTPGGGLYYSEVTLTLYLMVIRYHM